MALLAASGRDTVKLFDVSVEPGDPCTLSYTPSPGFQVNSLKWNHTNLVVASAGDDKRISLWHRNGQSMGTIPVAGSDAGDNIEESLLAINFSSKGSRYICSGGTGQVVRIWDLQRKRCVKWLRGHSDAITAVMYNCKDEHLASISLSGDLIIHNLNSGARATELKDPKGQVLRVLDYSRLSRHLLVTSGDDGSLHLWDTTGRGPKVSWLQQHSAPTAGISFSPSNDKMIASVGLDKKLYTFDPGSRRPSFCIPYEVPFSSLAFKDDGYTLAAGTSNGRVVFYDVRGKPQPFTVLRAYGNSEAVASLCWQRSKPIHVNEKNCTADTALLGGGSMEDSVLMPDPLPSLTSSTLSSSTTTTKTSRISTRSGPSPESFSVSETNHDSSTVDETPLRSSLWTGGSLARLQAPRNYKDDMEVFSPLVEVQPITPSLWDNTKRDVEKKTSFLFPSSKRFPFSEEGAGDPHPIFDWKSSSISKQDDSHRSFSESVSTPTTSSLTEDTSSVTPPEAWGGEKISNKLAHLRQSVNLPSRFSSLSSGPNFSGLQDVNINSSLSQTTASSVTSSSLGLVYLRSRDASSNPDTPLTSSEVPFISASSSLGSKGVMGQNNVHLVGLASTLPGRFSSYAERISANPSFNDGISVSVGSPKTKKTGAETREEILSSLIQHTEGGVALPQHTTQQTESQPGSSFTLQLFQGTLEETLASFQKSIHEDIRNLHIEVLRQFHMQEMQMSSVISSVLENQAELMKEIKSLRNENQQLRQLL